MATKKGKSEFIETPKIVKKPQKLSSSAFMRRLGFTLSEEQNEFVDAIYNDQNKIIFCNAKAGSGKTQMAMAAACAMVEYGMYDSINYIFPMINFQQELGLLPGTLNEKILPLYTPAIQALEELNYDTKRVIKQLNQTPSLDGAFVDCMPHTFLRGVNFKDSIVIIDEAQNMYHDELKKILTRVNDNCKVIVIGHDGQCDLYKHPEHSGFVPYLQWFKGQKFCQICNLTYNFRGEISRCADEFTFKKVEEDNLC